MNISVVHGGTSAESDISTKNANYIARALSENGHDVRMLEFDENTYLKLHSSRPDLVMIAVQGKKHGDGTMQSLCEVLGLPYTGTRAVAAALINNKFICKSICECHKIRTPEYVYFSRSAFFRTSRNDIINEIERHMKCPVVAKAVSQGGSFGIELVKTWDDFDLIAKTFEFDDEIIIERFIKGEFVTVSVLEIDNRPTALTVLEGYNVDKIYGELILFNRPFKARRAELSGNLLEELEHTALSVFKILGGKNYGRVDFIIEDETGLPYFLEINAVPGMKPESFFPQAAEMSGISFNELIRIITDNESSSRVK